jgi:hypothetical protein
MKYKAIILVIASRSYIYDKIINSYWRKICDFVKEKHNYEIKILLLFGNSITDDLNINSENILKFNRDESLIPGILQKTVDAFEYINKKYSYNVIFRTNISSFIILDNFLNLIDNFNFDTNKHIYNGVLGRYSDSDIIFCSGAGFFISYTTAQYIINNKNNIDYTLIDDVAIGKLLFKIKKCKIPRFDIINNIDNPNKIELLYNIIKNNHYHIRIKNVNNRLLDVKYLSEFSSLLYNL